MHRWELTQDFRNPSSGSPPVLSRDRENRVHAPVGDRSFSFEDMLVEVFFEAWREEEAVEIEYHGGSTPGARRRFRPTSLFRLQRGGPMYSTGYCELRRTKRTLKLDRARLIDTGEHPGAGWTI